MKKLMICVLMLACWSVKAQTFEGEIKWTMKMDITDPKIKAQMEAAANHKQSPEDQAKIKAMQDKMNDPQMKAMMESNPQMKAQMENAMKALGSGGANPNSMMPSGFTMKIKDDNTLVKVEGGMMASEILYNHDKDESYMLNREGKTYSKLPKSKSETGSQPSGVTAKVTKTSETAKILGYNCVKYNVDVTEHGRTINELIWTTTEIKNLDFKKIHSAKVGGGSSIFHEGMDGVPLRVVVTQPQGNMTMEVTEIKPESLSAADFVLPADFKETAGMFGR